MNRRTEAETRAYVEGYNACYEQFCEYLASKPFRKALTAMTCIIAAVNATVEERGEENE